MNRIKVSKNFSLHEFECRDGSHLVMLDEKLLELLQKMRDAAGQPIMVYSGYRTPAYNKQVGGAPTSQHLYGKAADISIVNMTVDQMAELGERCGADGIGKYYKQGFIHVDTRGHKARWIG